MFLHSKKAAFYLFERQTFEMGMLISIRARLSDAQNVCAYAMPIKLGSY